MGASSSVNIINENGRIYKELLCKCICSLVYDNYQTINDIELIVPCYCCLNKLKNNEYNTEKIKNLKNISKNKNVFDLLDIKNDNYWMNENDAILYAKKRKIPYEEFIPNDEFELNNPNLPKKNLFIRYNVKI